MIIFVVDINFSDMAQGNTTFGFELANHPNRFGFYPIMLRITRDRKKKRVKTGLEVKKSDWNQKAKNHKHFRSSYHNAEASNEMLADILSRYDSTYKELRKEGVASSENIIQKVKTGEVSESFLQYAKDRTQEIYDAGGVRNWKKYNGFCNKLETFLKKQKKHDISFSEITPSFLSKFDNFLHKLPNEREPEKLLHPNTIQVVLNIFKTIVNRVIEIDSKMKPEENPFLKFKYSGVKTIKDKLDEAELDAILALDLPEGSLIWNCRNYFFFSFYCAGIRVGDFVQLRWCNITSEGRLHYQMGKNHKDRDLKLVPEALEILKHYYRDDVKPNEYIFPLLDLKSTWAKYVSQEEKDTMPPDMKMAMFTTISAKTALINKELAKIGKLAGIEKKVSFHISRHSFAKMAKEKGVSSLEVKGLLAHTNLVTTEKYMGDLDTQKTDAALIKVFEKEDEADKVVEQLKGMRPEVLEEVLARLRSK
ncbi:site-specific recombinase, phage integrase family [Hoylesella timonensis CRIS 5C-B1]|uniref:Site-specific recombinase, phage integrase family n=2 Tax=Hoylesella timonensis TaxID=386414 RepID=D1W0H0_9BACT|nr:site-specific recombinase, phage integrase family [Hoylesella timonensis CRIS 5C-B1]